MSTTVIQTALTNAAANPELYSPSYSPVKGESSLKAPVVSWTPTSAAPPTSDAHLTHEAKEKLDASSQKGCMENKSEKEAVRQKLIRGHKNVVRWLDIEQYLEYDQNDIISPHDSNSPRSSADHLSLSSPGNGEVTFFTLLKEREQIPKGDLSKLRHWHIRKRTFQVLRSRYTEEERSDTAISDIVNKIPVPSPRTSAEEPAALRRQAARQLQRNKMSGSRVQELTELRPGQQQSVDTGRFTKPRTPLTPRVSVLGGDAKRRRALESEKATEKPEDAETPLTKLWREIESSWSLPKSAEGDDVNTTEWSPWDDEPRSDASMSVQSTEGLNATPEIPCHTWPLAQRTQQGITPPKTESRLPPGLLEDQYPTKEEAKWLYFWMRNRRARDRVEGRPIPFPEEPFPLERILLPKIMNTPSKKFRDNLEAARLEESMFIQRRPITASRPAHAAESQADAQTESESEYSAAQEEGDDKIHGIVSGENAPGSLREWLISKGYAKSADLHLHSYKGYNVDAPKLQLIRAKNFLSAHDATNTRDWDKKFDALCHYAEHLYNEYKDEDWGYDLFEVINMLQTHYIWEMYMFSKPELNTDINDGKGTIHPGLRRFPYDKETCLRFKKDYRPPGAPRLERERGSLAGKMPGLFIQPHCVEKPPEDTHIDPRAYTKGVVWFNEQERKWVEWTKEHAVKEAWGHRKWMKREESIMPLPPVANFNGPVVNILMDEEMQKTYETIKAYEKLVAKLRRTAWKTAVYGKREVLDNCLKAIERGIQGRVWPVRQSGGAPQSPDGDAVEEWQEPFLCAKELEWLDFLTWTAPSDPEPVSGGKELAIYLKRLETLLANPRGDGVFAKYAKKSLRTPLLELTDAINFGLRKGDVQRGPKKVYVFDEAEVWDYAHIAQKLGMVHRVIQQGHGEALRFIGELTVRGLLPEQRIRWSKFLIEKPTQADIEIIDPETSEDSEDSEDDSMSVDSVMSTPISIPSPEPEYNEYAEVLPKFSSLRSWVPQNDDDKQSVSEVNMTLKFYQNLGNRLGLDLHDLRETLKESERAIERSIERRVHPKDNMMLKNQNSLRDTLNLWTDEYNKRTRNSKNPAANGERQTPLFKDIVEIADPESQGRTWTNKDSWDDNEEIKAREKVRQGLIREAHANEPNLWPARCGNSSTDEPGNKFPSWRRENLWSFGAPEVRGFKLRQLFGINRWPLHLQSDEVQEFIKSSGPPVEDRPEKSKGPADQAILYGPTRFPGDNNRTFWKPGNEYWFGATPRQQREIWRRMHLPYDPTWMDKVAEFFGVKRKRDDQDDMDEFEAGSLRLPKPKHLPRIVANGIVVDRKAKRARLSD